MAGYRLSNSAVADLERLYAFGMEQFGLEQADRYYDGLVVRLQDIADNPWSGPEVAHLRPGLRRAVYFSHSIYYLRDAGGVHIVRIPGREDVMRALS